MRIEISKVVMIRHLKDAVVSLMIRAPHISVEQGLRDYIHFYGSILPYRGGYLLATFEDITRDFRAVTRRINSRFGTSFHLFDHTEENVEKAFRMVEQMHKQDTGLGAVEENTVVRPSRDRERGKEAIEAELLTPKVQRLLSEAESVFAKFIQQYKTKV